MTEQSAAPESGALSVEQAIAHLEAAPPEEKKQAPEAPSEAAAEPTENTEGETSAPGDAEDGAETPAEESETEAEPEAVAPAEPPRYWSQEAKAKFAELPPELQAVVLQQEGPREEAAAKVKAEAAEQVKAAQAQAKGVQTLAQQLESFLPDAIQTFTQRWGEPDWEATIEQYGAEEAAKLKARFDKEQGQLQKLAQAREVARLEAHKAFLTEQFEELAKIAPDLAPDLKDPAKGSDKRQAVVKYLSDAGVGRDAIAQISAVEMTLAHKAMLWDQAQKQLSTAPKPKPAANAKTAPVRPAASATHIPPQAKQADTARRRFVQTKSIDDAVAYLEAKGFAR